MKRPTLTVLFLLLAPAARTLVCDLQDVDPAQYGDVARHIVSSGNWLDLHDSKGPFTNKPPLLMWAQAVAMKVLGETASAARLGALAFALVLLGATYRLGRALFSEAAAATATVLVAGSVAFHMMLAEPKTDIAQAAMVTSALAVAVSARGRVAMVVITWALAALAVLAKGPTALVYVLSALWPWWWVRSPLRGRARISTGVAASRWWLGVPVLLAMCIPFYLTVFRDRGEEGAVFLLWAQGFGRLLGQSGYQDTTTPLFFIHTAIWALFPALWILGVAVLSRRPALPAVLASDRAGVALCLGWFMVTFVAVSLADYKLPHYIFSLIAPLSLLAARWVELHLTPDVSRASTFGKAFFAVSMAFAAVFLLPFSSWALGPLAAFGIAGWLGLGAVSRRPPPKSWPVGRLGIAGGGLAVSIAFHVGFYAPLTEFQAWPALVRRAEHPAAASPVTLVLDTLPPFSAAFAARGELLTANRDEVATRTSSAGPQTVIAPAEARSALENTGLSVETLLEKPDFPTSRPSLSFLRPSHREEVLRRWSVFRVSTTAH